MACLLELGRKDVPTRAVEPALVTPVEPGCGGELDLFGRSPGASASDQLGLVEAVDRLGEGVVIAVALRSHRVHDACFGQALGVADGQILRAAAQPRASTEVRAVQSWRIRRG